MTDDAVVHALEERLGHAVLGGITVRSARVERTQNAAGEEAYRATLVVDDPQGATWPVQDLTDLDVLANRIAAEVGAGEYVYVSLTAASEAEVTEAS